MKNHKNSLFYIIVTGGFVSIMFWIIKQGKFLEGDAVVEKSIEGNHFNDFLASISHNMHHPLAILLVQIITIIIVARFFGWLFKKIGQPSVIGEIIAGIVLGPSLVGMYFPEYSLALFPKEFTIFEPDWVDTFYVRYWYGTRP